MNGAGISYEKLGDGEPIVLIHGNMVDYRMWNEQFRILSRSFTVVRLDLRGYGKSSFPNEPYSFPEDVRALLDFLQIRRTNVIGLSLGADVAFELALAYPDRVLNLVVVPGGGLSDAPPAPWMETGFNSIREAIIRGDRMRASTLLLELRPLQATMENRTVAKQVEEMVRAYSWVHFQPGAPPNREWERAKSGAPKISQRLGEIRARTLVLTGERDAPEFCNEAAHLKAHMPHATMVVMKGAGHMVNMERPRKFNKVVLDFMRLTGRGPHRT